VRREGRELERVQRVQVEPGERREELVERVRVRARGRTRVRVRGEDGERETRGQVRGDPAVHGEQRRERAEQDLRRMGPVAYDVSVSCGDMKGRVRIP
jgi:hypothetical protein